MTSQGKSDRIITVDAKGFIDVIIDGNVVQTLFMEQCIGSHVKICPNGRYIYIEKTSAIYDLQTSLTISLTDAKHICFSADSQRIAYCASHSYCDIHVMDVASQQVTKISTNSLKHPVQIEFYSDENYIVLAGTEQIMIIEIRTGLIWKCMKVCDLQRFLVSASGSVCIESASQVHVWNLRTCYHKIPGTLRNPLKKYFNVKELATNARAWSISDKSLVLSLRGHWDSADCVQLFDLQTRKELLRFQTTWKLTGRWKGHDTISLIFSPDRDCLMATRDTQSEIYSMIDGSLISILNHSNPIVAVHWCC